MKQSVTVQKSQHVARERPVATAQGFPARTIVRAVRPRQAAKNLVLYAALLFTVHLAWQPAHPETWLPLLARATLAFAAFCAVSAAGYLINDLRDVDADRLHPRKRTRPIASGALSGRVAALTAGALYAGGLVAALPLGRRFVLAICLYGALVGAYTLVLKRVVLVDVLAIASGFVIRAVAGALAIGVPVSPWLYVCTLLGASLLAVNKRRDELVLLGDAAAGHRAALAGYSLRLADVLSAGIATATVGAYVLYALTAANLPHNHAMLLTTPFVVCGVVRYLLLMRRHDGGTGPEDVLVRDKPLLACLALWLATVGVVLAIFR